MKKLFTTALFTLTALLAAPAQAQPSGPLTIWVLSDHVSYFKAVAGDFQKAYPGVTVTVRDYPNEQYKTAIQVGVASNQPPDVFHNDPGEASFKFARAGQVLDLTATARAAGWDKTLVKGALGGYTLDGKLWGAPWTQQSKFMFYSKDIFTRAHLTPPTTFTQLLSTCKTLKGQGITPISFGNSERWPGIHYLTILNQKVVGEQQIAQDYSLRPAANRLFTDPGYAQALQRLKDMQDAGCFNTAVNSVTPELAQASFYTGKSAMNFCGTWCLGVLDDNGFKGKYSIFRFPAIAGGKGNQDTVISGPSGLQVSAKTKNRETALAFVTFVLGQQEQARLVQDTQRIPVNTAATKGLTVDPALGTVISNLNSAQGATLWLDSAVEAGISDTYQNVIQEVLNGTSTPQQAMAKVRAAALTAKQKLGR